MSGIVGMLHLDGRPASPEVVAAMSRAIVRRGIDDAGQTCRGPVGLAQRTSVVTPESREEIQPLGGDGEAVLLVADARIDNRAELASALGLRARRVVTDAELILRAWERWREGCAARLVGDFAFALWDGRARRLFCARDVMGVRPFYYHASSRLFAFASEVKALFVLPEVSRDLDPLQVARFVEGIVDDRDGSIFASVRRLPAAHTLNIDASGLRVAPYWRPDPANEVRFARASDYADAFRELFSEVVQARLRSVHPVGAALSGGLDSSSIVCMARQLQRSALNAPLHAFSLVFPSLPEQDRVLIDERRHIDAVGATAGVHAVPVRGDLLSPVAGIDEVLDALDEPYLAPNLYLHQAMYRAAHDAGVRVFLDGFDGDTTVSHGFGRLCALVHEHRWSEFEAELRATAGNRAVSPATLLAYFGRPYLRTLARRGDWRGWLSTARELRRRFRLSFRDLLVRDGFAARAPRMVDGVRRLRRRDATGRSLLRPALLRELRRHTPEGVDPDIEATLSERAAHAAALDRPAYQLTLEMADKCAAGFGVEARYPFFDRRLIEFCLALPDEQKLDGGWTRLVLRRAMAGILPPDVQWRPDKGNLSPNFHRALRSSAAIRFDRDSLAVLEPYVNVDGLRELSDAYIRAERTLARADDGHALFRAVVLSRWLRRRECDAPTGPRAPPSSVAA